MSYWPLATNKIIMYKYLKISLVSFIVLLSIISVRADLNSGVEDEDDSLDSATGGAAMKHRDDIINSLPQMPTERPKEPTGKLHIGIKKRAETCERKAEKGDVLHMHYRGSLRSNGQEFDNSYKRGQPLIFTLGEGRVIKGWDQGLIGICAGDKWKLIIPPHLAYGETGSGSTIPPDSTLVFEVEAVKVEPANEANRQDL